MNNKSFKLNSIVTAMIVVGGLSAGSLQAAEGDNAEAEQAVEVIEVTGFRGSLSRALFEKRNSVNNKETVMSEDMGKFPDLNLAESIQRVPGVAISREGGEGRQITVRGLSPSFTRTTLNGMEVPASTDGLDSSGGFNSSRAFDFNVFASELFNQIDIQKVPTASVEEGGIAATVDLYTAKPFNNPGLHYSVGGQVGYNDLTEASDPRFSAMVSNTFLDDTLGVLVSVAKTERTVRQEGYGTVRWTTPEKNSREWADISNTVVNGTPDVGECASTSDLNCLWTPRLPRTDYFGNDQERLGFTTAIQYQANDDLLLGFDFLHSEFDNYRESLNYFEMFRNSYGGITPVDITLDSSGRYIEAGTFDGVYSRSESRLTKSSTEFNQYVFNASYDLNDDIIIDAMVGHAESDFRVEQYRFNMTSIDSHRFAYDFRENADVSTLEYGYDHMDPENFAFSGPTIRANDATRENSTFKLDLTWALEDYTIKTGIIANNRSVDTLESNISDRTTPDSTAGLTRGVPVSNYGTGLDAPANFPSDFLVVDFNKTIAAYNLGAWVPDLNDGQTWSVEEKTFGAYVEADTEYEIADMPFMVNLGVRAVRTESAMGGAIADAEAESGYSWIELESSYTEVLPSANFVLKANDDLQFRLNIARTMTRPSLSSLTPTASISGINGTISAGNPSLDPFLANGIDLGFEWYFAEESVIAATYFYKDIDSFIARKSEEKYLEPVYAQAVLNDPSYDAATWVDPVNEKYDHSIPLNNDGATLDGFEFMYQQPFSFLPGPLSNLGVTLNYTYVDSETVYGDNDFSSPLEGLSKHTSNFTVYYEEENYGARISANTRDDYITDATGSNGNQGHGTTGGTRIDLSSFWNVTDKLTISLEGINLTDEKERLFVTGDGTMDLVREYNHTGRQIFLGFRYTH